MTIAVVGQTNARRAGRRRASAGVAQTEMASNDRFPCLYGNWMPRPTLRARLRLNVIHLGPVLAFVHQLLKVDPIGCLLQ